MRRAQALCVAAAAVAALLVIAVEPAAAAPGDLRQLGTPPTACVGSPGGSPHEACLDLPSVSGQPVSSVASPDGKSVYVAVAGTFPRLAVLQRDPTTGAVTADAGCVSSFDPGCTIVPGLGAPSNVAVSPDNKTVYVVSHAIDTVTVFARNTTTGTLTKLPSTAGCVSDTGAGGCTDGVALDGPLDVTVSPDNKTVYVASSTSSAVAVLSRQTTTSGGTQGRLTPLPGAAGCVSQAPLAPCAVGRGLTNVGRVAVSSDSKSVYAGGSNIAVFARQTTTSGGLQGRLTQLNGAAGCLRSSVGEGCGTSPDVSGQHLVVSPDGKSVYTGSGSVRAYSRQTTTANGNQGALTAVPGPTGCITGVAGGGCTVDAAIFMLAFDPVVSADGKSVYFGGIGQFGSVSMLVYARQTTTTGGTLGGLTPLPSPHGCAAGCDGGGFGFTGFFDLAVSADAKTVLATGDGRITLYARQTTTTGGLQGRLSPLGSPEAGCVSESGAPLLCADGAGLGGAFATATSPDGKSVYVASSASDAVVVLSRNATTGALTQVGCVSNVALAGCTAVGGLDGAAAVEVSPDGKSVYVAASAASTVRVFARNTSTGALSSLSGQAGCVAEVGNAGCADGRALSTPNDLTVSPDGKTVYVASVGSSAVAVFARQTTTTGGTQGKLTQLAGLAGCVSNDGTGGLCTNIRGLVAASSVAVSRDGKSVYATGVVNGGIATFARQTTTAGGTQGALTQLAGPAGCMQVASGDGCAVAGAALGGAADVVVSPDSKSVYVVSSTADTITGYSRQTTTAGGTQGKLTLVGVDGCISEGVLGGCVDGRALDGARRVAISPDGKTVYASSGVSNAVAVFTRQTTTTGGLQGRLTQSAGTNGCLHATGAGTCSDVHSLDSPFGIAVSPDRKHVYVASFNAHAVLAFARALT